MGMALEWALATYVRVLRQKPAGLPEPVLAMLMQVYAKVKSAPRSEKKAVALNELKLRLGTAKELAKSLDLPVGKCGSP
jgi:predicted nucleic acid-binding protein